jgi:tRNA U34 5-carboxymethylaminomethyl modifying GTPase MnmE/TrmE
MEISNKDTIVAISTGSSSGAISIVRMSGENAVNIADQMFFTRKNISAKNEILWDLTNY